MAASYDKINQLKEKYLKIIAEKDKEICSLKEKLDKLEKENTDYRQKLYAAGEGKGERNRLEKEIISKERENKTLQNKIRDLDGSKLISTFNPDRQKLIKDIKALKFQNSIFDSLARKFKDGLDNVIEIAYLIKNKSADHMDYYTFVFRDDIVGLLEKMFRAIIGKHEDSASKYLVKLKDGIYDVPKEYYLRIPKLKDKTVVTNILYLINLESVSYHGSNMKVNHLVTNHETNEKENPNKFLNLDSEAQLTAIFTLLEFMYFVFTNKDREMNLLSISSSWFKTI